MAPTGRRRFGKRLSVMILALLPLFSANAGRAAGATQARVLASVATARRVVALTFDDGPSPYTPQVLALLGRYHAHATFFVVGNQVARYPQLVRAAHEAGDEIGNHTYSHANLQYLSAAAIAMQINATNAAVRAAAGVEPGWLRPPYGAVDSRVAAVASSLGMQTILWSVDPRDWSLPGVGIVIARVLAAAQPGSVVILHDGGGDRSETVAALATILGSLSARGFQFLTLSQLFASGGPCDLQGALQHFSARGFAPRADQAIFQQWENLYCAGTDLGPATSREYAYRRGMIRQDFALTGHRLTWNPKSGTVRATPVWPWAIKVFEAHGVPPAWHTAITAAWFAEFFAGRDWGPAQSRVFLAAWGRWQQFQRGAALQRGRTVRWRPGAAGGPAQGQRSVIWRE